MKKWQRIAINEGAQALVQIPGRRNTMSVKAVSDYEIEAKHAIGNLKEKRRRRGY